MLGRKGRTFARFLGVVLACMLVWGGMGSEALASPAAMRATSATAASSADMSRSGKVTAKKDVAKKAAKKVAKRKIGASKASAIALRDARLGKSQVKRLDVALDREDGRLVYEVEFRRGRLEYEYDIDAYTGRIVDRDIERIKR